MRKIYTGFLMVAVATASFAVGRSTSGPAPSAGLASENAASIEAFQMQPTSRSQPELPADTLYHAYLVFAPDR